MEACGRTGFGSSMLAGMSLVSKECNDEEGRDDTGDNRPSKNVLHLVKGHGAVMVTGVTTAPAPMASEVAAPWAAIRACSVAALAAMSALLTEAACVAALRVVVSLAKAVAFEAPAAAMPTAAVVKSRKDV